jgi:hypothetical protein
MNIESTILFYTNQLKTHLTSEEEYLSKKKIPKKSVRPVYNDAIELLFENQKRLQEILRDISTSKENLRICKEKLENDGVIHRMPFKQEVKDTVVTKALIQYTLLFKDSIHIRTDLNMKNIAILRIVNNSIDNLQQSEETVERLLQIVDERIRMTNASKVGTLEGIARETIARDEIQPNSYIEAEVVNQPYKESEHIFNKKGGKKKNTYKKRTAYSRRKQMPKKKTFRKR